MTIPTQVILDLKSTNIEILDIECRLNGQKGPLNLFFSAFQNQDNLYFKI